MAVGTNNSSPKRLQWQVWLWTCLRTVQNKQTEVCCVDDFIALQFNLDYEAEKILQDIPSQERNAETEDILEINVPSS